MTYLGIDPGKSGGLCALDAEGGVLSLIPTPVEPSGILSWILLWDSADTIACMELVSGWIGGNVKSDSGEDGEGGEAKHSGAPGSHMFEFGKNVGRIEGCLAAAGFSDGQNLHMVRPQEWQRVLGVEPRRKMGRRHVESKPQFKSRLRQYAASLFPQVDGITLKTADATMLALYCYRRYGR